MNFLTLGSTDPHFNMAFDQVCLEEPLLDEPVFWLWQNRPSVIIGLNQNPFAEVNLPWLRQRGIVLARRVTGGGAVYHDLQNLNYTITGRSRDLARDYPDYLDIVVRALRALGVPAEINGRNDIMVGGRKCSGFAKRVYKDRLMVHGTLMFDVDLEEMSHALAAPSGKLSAAGIESVRSRVANLRDCLPGCAGIDEFRSAMQEQMACGGHRIEVSPALLQRAQEEAERKFSTWEWIYGRSPAASFKAVKKFPCGTVEAFWGIRHGRLSGLCFGGDFIGNVPADALAEELEGCPMEREALARELEKAKVQTGDCFDGLHPQDIIGLLFTD